MEKSTIKMGCEKKCKRLKKSLRELTYCNAALCSEITVTESRIQAARLERKLLLKKLLQFENLEDKRSRTVAARSNKADCNQKQSAKKGGPSRDGRGPPTHGRSCSQNETEITAVDKAPGEAEFS